MMIKILILLLIIVLVIRATYGAYFIKHIQPTLRCLRHYEPQVGDVVFTCVWQPSRWTMMNILVRPSFTTSYGTCFMHSMIVYGEEGKLLHFYAKPYHPEGKALCMRSHLHTDHLSGFIEKSNKIGTTVIEVWRPPRTVYIDLRKVIRDYCHKPFSVIPLQKESYECTSFTASLLVDLGLLPTWDRKKFPHPLLQGALKENGFTKIGRFGLCGGEKMNTL